MISRTAIFLVSGFVFLAAGLSFQATPAPAAPPYFQKLIDSGEVKFEFYDPQKKQMPFPGRTNFFVSIQRDYQFQYKLQQRGSKRKYIALVQVKATGKVTHTTILPQRYNEENRWKTSLVQHEFDHIASSQDPRLILLAQHISEKVKRIEYTLEPGETADSALGKRLINEELARRVHAIVALIRFNYKLLDQVSRHGQQAIPDRVTFFESLYTKPNLDQAGFAYTGDALGLLRSKEYREVELPYAP